MQHKTKKSINDKFTELADIVSETIGLWWVTAISIVFVLIWLAFGPSMGFSNTWQLLINTPTTIVELWLGFLIAAATNRSERRSRELQQQQKTLLEDAAEKETQIQRQEKSIEELVEQLRMMEVKELLPLQHTQLGFLKRIDALQDLQMEILQLVKDHVSDGGNDLRTTELVTSPENQHL